MKYFPRCRRQVEGATGQGNQNDLTLHFGLGERTEPVRVEVRWPDGHHESADSPVDRTLVLDRARLRTRPVTPVSRRTPRR